MLYKSAKTIIDAGILNKNNIGIKTGTIIVLKSLIFALNTKNPNNKITTMQFIIKIKEFNSDCLTLKFARFLFVGLIKNLIKNEIGIKAQTATVIANVQIL